VHSSAPDPCATLNLGWGSVLHVQASSFVRSARHGPCGWPIPSVSQSVPSIHPSIRPSSRRVQSSPPASPQGPGPESRVQGVQSPEPRAQSPEGEKEREGEVGRQGHVPSISGSIHLTHPSSLPIHLIHLLSIPIRVPPSTLTLPYFAYPSLPCSYITCRIWKNKNILLIFPPHGAL
jgi:hypothetical protein